VITFAANHCFGLGDTLQKQLEGKQTATASSAIIPTIYWTSFRGITIGTVLEVNIKDVGRRTRWNMNTSKAAEHGYDEAQGSVSGWSGYFNALIFPPYRS
jgi:hypothetical protein